ncbi:MAG: hypothetical protein IJ254_08755 [Succinivibrio sp.]|jgi:hypothetical protein|nr:hypothetical protein [Succinivibrio sp.]
MKHQIYIDPNPEDKSDIAFEKVTKYHEDVFKKLEHVGITFSYKKYFCINFDEDIYNSVVLRGAGRKKVAAVSEEGHPVKCAEVVQMMQTMTDYEIMDKLKMKKATYYRHKKAMLESNWYKDHGRNLELNDPNITDYIIEVSPVF